MQSSPLLPQNAIVSPGMQVPPAIALQQPFGQVVAEQMHCPFTHCCPDRHCWQTPPPVPQASLSDGRQSPFWQQPFGQCAASQPQMPFCLFRQKLLPPFAWFTGQQFGPQDSALLERQVQVLSKQICPLPHARHVAPPVPQAALVVPGETQVAPWQQPLGQLVASQTHCPFRQRWPVAQALHVPPAVPQCASLLCRQTSPLQQPLAQLCAVQVQRPPTHAWPLPQSVQVPPPVPQFCTVVPARQVLPAQQPLAQLWAVQTHCPPLQTWPSVQQSLPHALPAGQVHCPFTQLCPTPQVMQVPPGLPQIWGVVPGRHWSPLQQPLGQLAAVQVQRPATHACPLLQATQVSPVAPHAASVVPGWQVLPWQQPLGQLCVSQTHWPLAQRCPAWQTAHVLPVIPHAWFVLPGWQASPWQQPFGQPCCVQWQTPLTHSWPVAQLLQVVPPAPQACVVAPGKQAVPWQQPSGQLCGEQAHWPLVHATPLGQPQTPCVQQPPGHCACATQTPALLQQSPALAQGSQTPLRQVWQLPQLSTQAPLAQHWPRFTQVVQRPVFGSATLQAALVLAQVPAVQIWRPVGGSVRKLVQRQHWPEPQLTVPPQPPGVMQVWLVWSQTSPALQPQSAAAGREQPPPGHCSQGTQALPEQQRPASRQEMQLPPASRTRQSPQPASWQRLLGPQT